MNKNILILNHNQEGFGTYWRCKNIGIQLARRGYDVSMICASGANCDFRIRRKPISERFTIFTLPRFKYHKYFSGQILRMFITAFIVLFARYDICYAFTVAQPQIGFPAWISKKLRRKPLIVDWDDLWGGGFADMHGSSIKSVLTFCESFFPKYADRITYVSELIGRRIDSIPGIVAPRTKIVNGASVEKIQVMTKRNARQFLGLVVERLYIVSVGNTYTESLGGMLKAFEIVRNTIDNVFLVMVGNCDFGRQYSPLLENIKESIILEGSQQFDRIPFYLAAADCLLLPMEDNPIEHARFPMRLGDYLCAQRPIVSNAVGEVKHYLEKYNAGLTSSPGDYNELAMNIIKVLNNENISGEIALNARKLAENDLNWSKIGEKIDKEVFLSL